MSSLLLMPSASNVVAISNWIFNLVHISSVIVTNWVPFISAALQAAVHAFKQEDHVCEFTSMKAAKRKREQPEQQTEGSDGKTLAQMERRWLWYICLHIPFCFVWAVICHLLVMHIVSSVHTITIIGASSEQQGVIFLVSSMVSSV